MHWSSSSSVESIRAAAMRAGLGVMLAAASLIAGPASAAPFRPADGKTVIHVVPRWVTAARAEARSLDARLETDATDLPAALAKARLAIREGRASADPRLYGRAQAALAPWWRDAPAPLEVRILRAVIRQASHDFAGALADLDSVLAASPGNGQARLSRAFVLQAMGALDRAGNDCRALPRSVGLSAAAACTARVAALRGDGALALERLSRVMALDRRADSAMRRFATSIAAEIAGALGRDEEAEGLLVAAAEGGTDLPSLVAYADFLLDAGRPMDVLALLADHADIDSALLRLAIAGKASGDPRAGGWASLLAERFAVARAGSGPLHLREEARFELEVRADPKRALVLASENWAIEKEPADARLVLAAALAAGRPEAAEVVLEFVTATGLEDRRIERLREYLRSRPAGLHPASLDPPPHTR